jgi:TonB family protein
VKPRVISCGEKISAKGTVRISLTVGPDGVVKDASVVESPAPELGNCVATALRAAHFDKSAKGGSFTYPFVF